MKVLLTGATGFLGREVRASLARDHEVTALGHRSAGPGGRTVDLRDPDALRRLLRETRPDVVVHTAAYRDPDFCEADPDETRRLNTAPVALMCAELPPSARVLFVSTDYVFDGDRPPYREDSPRSPVNVYGQSKLEAEDHVARRPNGLTLRIPLLVGAGPTFETSGFLAQIAAQLDDPRPQEADGVLVRFPTWIRDVAEAIAFLVARGAAGVVHYSGAEALTRHDCLRIAGGVLGRSVAHIRPTDRVIVRRARRPVNSQLATDRIRALGFARFTPFAEVVRDFARTHPALAPSASPALQHPEKTEENRP